jgi:transposase-like protein
MDKTINKEAIIAEYLAGGTSYRKLSTKYGIKHQTIHEWVLAFQGRRKVKIKVAHFKGRNPKNQPSESDVKKLQQELVKAQLHNKLLNAMIDIAEEQLGVPIRKKSGAKQS